MTTRGTAFGPFLETLNWRLDEMSEHELRRRSGPWPAIFGRASVVPGPRFPARAHHVMADGLDTLFDRASAAFRAGQLDLARKAYGLLLHAIWDGGEVAEQLPGEDPPGLLETDNSWRMARMLHQSLHERVLTLPDTVRVLPTHGGGSFCAAGAGGKRETTIGSERAQNSLVRAQSEREYIAPALHQGPYPAYFGRMRGLNQIGAPLLGRRLPEPRRLSLDEFDGWRAQSAAILDLRSPEAFAEGHIPGSHAIGVDGSHSAWVGWLIPADRSLVLIANDAAQERESIRQLARIGYDLVAGSLEGGFRAWASSGRPVSCYPRILASDLERRLLGGERLVVVDVREASEWFAGRIPGSVNLPVHEIPLRAAQLPAGATLAIHRGHVYRATLGASLFEQSGHAQVIVVQDGYDAWADRRARCLDAAGA